VRFLLASSPRGLERARPPVRVFLGLVLLFLAGGVAQRLGQGAVTPDGIAARYLGVAVDGLPGEPMATLVILEEAHVAAFFSGVLLLALGSLVVAARLPVRARRLLVWGSAGAALVDLGAPLLMAMSGVGASARAVAFVLTTAGMAAMAVVALTRFGRAG
jgi:hypothetical protein